MNSSATQSPSAGARKVAILVTDGFEQVELTGPRQALQDAGFTTQIIAPKSGQVQGFNHDEKADTFPVDSTLDQADPAQFDAVLLPGGVVNADALRTEAKAQAFVKAIDQAGKPIAVICHGAWLLVDADLVRGKTLTSWPSLATDLRNAGATWVDETVHVEGRWVSSRKPDDIPAFNEKLVETVGA
ncbi:type 1 glutamine amidotransferase domain-containing protein [Paracidovorax valerianellae]|uniref:Protease I n=1 Tax=Paracidovorax valerianellae TaxID=187868 RepID=A0A1G6RBZ7_9BURK|nr:type 1 glutamine amidotransferase domain-containing protein [Paracidovorax valerianellae]MDA8445047.1 type 1 glutamine amidotransferase [Paracidovorax valerianellae]SDD02152.1 protease I [Paracidovorax valerianellae]